MLFSTMRQPAFAVAAMPLLEGVLPTTTQPPGSTSSAVVRPTPPGHDPGSMLRLTLANSDRWPPGEISTSVLPVPCWFALSLKLLISTSPARRRPVLCRMIAMPYGLTSPLCGTVEAIVESLLK